MSSLGEGTAVDDGSPVGADEVRRGAPEFSESTEESEMTELPVSGDARDADALHGADDPREFRLQHPGEYVEPIGRARPVDAFQDPREAIDRVNPEFNPAVTAEHPYNVNCADCARCGEATWRGQQQEAAGRPTMEGEMPDRTEQWAHDTFERTTPEDLRAALERGGHGSSAIVGSTWSDGGHAYNVVNYRGEILTADYQIHEVFPYSDLAIHPGLEDADDAHHWAMAWDARGRRIA